MTSGQKTISLPQRSLPQEYGAKVYEPMPYNLTLIALPKCDGQEYCSHHRAADHWRAKPAIIDSGQANSDKFTTFCGKT
jgi:hypothetical protein